LSLGAGESRSITYANGYYSFSYANNSQSSGGCVNGTQYTANPFGPLALNGTFLTGMHRAHGGWSWGSATLTYKRVGVATSAGSLSIANGTTICMNDGGSISASNTAHASLDVGSNTYIWYVGYSTDGGATYTGWKDSWTSGNVITTAAGTGASLGTYNPQSDYPGYTHYRIIRRALSDCQKDVNGNWVNLCLNGCQDVYFNVAIGPNAPQALGNITCGPAAGLTGALPNSSFSASGCWNGGGANSDCSDPGTGGHQAWRGRVFRDFSDGGVVGWAVDQNNTGDWWQVDLGSIRPVNGVASQGREDADQWLTQYTVQLSYDGSNWFNVPGTFTANGDRNTVVTNWFGQFHARYVRINTVNGAFNGHQSARFEVLSIPEGSSNTVVLSADIVPFANQVRWYTTPTGGSPITTGGSFTVGTNGRTLQITGLTENTTYYAEAFNSTTGCASPTRTAVIARINDIYGDGPAGIGNTNGRSLNNLWLDGNSFNNTADGSAVSTWTDKSGRGYHATQGTSANQPTVQTQSAMNNQKVVRGDGTNDFISTSNAIYNYSGSFYGSNVTPFSVFGIAKYNGTNSRLISGGSNNWLLGHHGNLVQRAYYEGWLTGSCNGGGTSTGLNDPRIVGGDRNRFWSRFFDNGTLIAEANCGTQAPGGFALFSYQGTSEFSNGDIGEVIAYELVQNTARRRIIENYLSAKYNVTISGDLYVGDNTANGDCDFDVSGVGRELSAGIGLHLEGRSGGLRINTAVADFLKDDGDYIIFGRNTGQLGWETSDLPTCGSPNPSRRLSRIWYLDKTDVNNNGGNVTLTFDVGTTLISGTYRLLYRATNSGNFSSIASTTSISGSTVAFTINATSINDGQYTLGYDADIPRSISFNGTNQYLTNSSPTSLNVGSAVTVEAWVRPNATQGDATFNGIVSWGPRSGTGTSMLLSIDNNLRPTMATWGNDYAPGTGTALTAGEWNHLACVVNGTTVQFYINGTLTHTGTLGVTPNIQNGVLNIGCTDNPGRYFAGQIDEVRIWNVARSAADIASARHQNINNASSGWNNLVAYYKLNEASGVLYDHSRNTNNLSRVNSAPSVDLHPASPNTISAQTICNGSSTTFTVTNTNANSRLTYSWSVPSGVTIVSGGTTPTVSVTGSNSTTSPITYTLTVTESHSNECHIETQTASLTVRPTPAASISGSVTVCKDAPAPTITFTNPTTLQIEVTYKVNGGADQTIVVNGSSSANVSAAVTGTVGTYNYVIQSVKFTSAPDCNVSASGTATVTVVADPSISGLSAATICKGGTHTFTPTTSGGTGTFTYIWEYNSGSWNAVVNGTPAGFTYTQTGANLQINTTTGVGAGTYQYRLRFQASGSGCDEAISTVNLVVNDPPTITSHPTSTNVCEGNSVNLNVAASGGISPLSYVWQYFDGTSWVNAVNGTPSGATYTGLGTTSITISGLNGGTGSAYYQYRCVVQSSGGSGCNDATSSTATVGIHKYPNITNSSAAMCQGETKNLTTDLDLTSGVTWTSSPCPSCVSGAVFTAPDPGGTSANYTLTARNANLNTCSNFFIQTVYKAHTITSSSADMCEGETRSLTATPAGGTFSGTGVSGSTFTAPTPTGASQTYTITYVVAGSACPADTQNITVYRNPTVSNAGADFSSCGLTVTLNGNNPTFGTGTWTTQAGPGTITYANTSQHNTNATASVAGTYTLRWTISNGACPSSQDEVDVTFYNSLSASGTPDTILVCTDSIVNITGSVSGGFGTQTFLWQFYDAGTGNWVAAPGVNNTINYTTQPLSNTSTTVDKIYRFRLQYSRSGCPSPVLSNETYAKVFAVPSLTGTNDECASIIGSNNYDYIYTVGSSIYSPFTVSDYSGGATLMYGPTEAFKIYRIPFGSGNHTFVITDANGCQVFSDIAKSSALPITIPNVTIPGTSNGNCFIKNYDEWVHIKRASNPNQVIASIRDNDVDLGLVNVICYRDSHAVLIPNSGPFCIGAPIMAMRRHFKVTSTTYNDPSIPFVNSLNVPTDVTVRLYFSDADLADLKNAALANDTTGSNCDYDDNIYSINGLYITKYSDYLLSGTEDSIYTNNYPTASYYKVFSPATATATVDSASGFDALFGTSGANIHYAQMDVSEFSEFWLHGSQNGSPLPVEMLYIEARNINNSYIQIRWATAFELNNWKFEVERSTDGVNFAKIGEVIGHGTTTERHDYVYNDKEVVAGIRYYYRLKQIDFDESYEYSPIVSEMLKGEDFFRVSEFIPNPAAHQAKLIINTGKEQEIQVEMHNYLGEIVKKGNTFLNKGSNTITFEFEELAAGTYTTRIVAGNSTYIRRLVIAK
jgi:hypothetical protein